MDRLYRFSPIKNKAGLLEAIRYIHFEAHRLLKQNLGYLWPVSGNIGVFCHYDDEFERLTKMRKSLTDESDNWNQKYFRLHTPITIPAKDTIPETTYTYLYIRKPEVVNSRVGDVDFYLEPDKYRKLKQSLLSGRVIKGVKIFERPNLDLIRLYDKNIDVSAFVGSYRIEEVATKSSLDPNRWKKK